MDEEVTLPHPSLDVSLSKDDRIRSRRERVQAAIEAEHADEDDGRRPDAGADSGERDDVGIGMKQVLESEALLDDLKQKGNESVTEIRVKGDHAENERRIAEDVSQDSRTQKLMEESKNSAMRNAAIAMRWNALYDIDIPQDLMEEIKAQEDACSRVTEGKERLVSEFRDELRQKDEEYVTTLRKQADDIDSLITRMGESGVELRKSYESQLEAIEKSYMEERAELLRTNMENIDELCEKRRELERDLLETRLRLVEEHQSVLEQMREESAQNYNRIKISKQLEIQELERESEEMRARYLLNSEKLDYNHRVLADRVVQNKQTYSQHKRKLSRLQDGLSVVKAKYAKADKQYKQQNDLLTEQYRRITEQYKELQKKFKYFEKVDRENFMEVWKMNEEIAMDLVKKLWNCDRVIMEQQLGMEWFPPNEDIFNSPLEEGAEAPVVVGGPGLKSGASDRSTLRSGTPARPVTDNVKKMLELLCDEAGFLVDEKLENVVSSLRPDERRMVRVDNILKVLGVETQSEIESMLPYFTKITPGDDISRAEIIPADTVMQAIRDFVEDQQRSAARQSPTVSVSIEDRARKRQREEEKAYWRRLMNAIPDQKVRLWKVLETSLQKYLDVLQQRSKLLDETDGLRQQNDELRALLDQYMSSKINEELYVPPVVGQTAYAHEPHQ